MSRYGGTPPYYALLTTTLCKDAYKYLFSQISIHVLQDPTPDCYFLTYATLLGTTKNFIALLLTKMLVSFVLSHGWHLLSLQALLLLSLILVTFNGYLKTTIFTELGIITLLTNTNFH